ncbi:cellulose biosynthesis protein BcsC [Melaminivora suipulveris]|nr:cellulose biosynthesis protein BcsC [Melaminivora suipulveris]
MIEAERSAMPLLRVGLCAGLALALMAGGPAAAAQPAAALAPPATASGAGAAEAELMRNARMWLARGRSDLARQNLEKILALNPRSPEAMATLGSVALQDGDFATAQRLLEEMRQQSAEHGATADLAAQARVYGQEQEKLARMRLLARAGRTQEAAQLARELFPDAAPGVGVLALEYARLVGSAPAPTAPRPAEAAPVPTAPTRANEAAAPRALEVAPSRAGDVSARPLQLERRAGGVPALAREQHDVAAQDERAAPDPARLALEAAQKALDADDLATAQQQLQNALARRPHDADALGTLGLVRLRQGRHAQAREMFAQAHQLSGAQKWQDLVGTARFWGALAQAQEASRSQQWDRAAELAQEALVLQSDHPRALNALAAARAGQGRADEALTVYEATLQHEPGNDTALRGVVDLLMRQGRAQEALARLDAQQPAGQAQQQSLAQLRSGLLAAVAADKLKAGQPAAAAPLLRSAVEFDPADPWLRHRLARVHLQLGHRDAAQRVMDEGVALRPREPDMRHARALIRSAIDDDAGAREDLLAIDPAQRSENMRSLLRTAALRSELQQARRGGVDAAALMERAETQAGEDPALLLEVANAWFRLEQPQQATAVFERLAQRQRPLPSQAALERAAVLARARNDDRLGALLGPLLDREGWSDAQALRLLQIQTGHLERRIEGALAAGDDARAQRLSRISLLPHPGLSAAQRARSRGILLLAAQDWPGAAREFSQALPELADDVDVRMGMAQAQARSGQRERAREHAQWLAAHLPQDDRGQQLALLRLWQRIDAPQEARALSQQLLQRHPGDTGVLLHAARLEQSQDRHGQALSHYQQALASAGTEPQERQAIEASIRSIEARRQSWVETGVMRIGKSATPGVSTLRGWQVPAVAWMPRGYDGHHFLHVDQLYLNAGALPSAAGDVASYGQVGAWPAPDYPAAPGTPRARGVNVGVGYRGSGLEWDLGLTGIGFPVTNVVGGIAYGQWREDFAYRVELSRRPLTGSLVSYAGAHDPVTGQVWGGVVATGVSARVSRPWGGSRVALSGSYAALQGRNVQDNTRAQLRASIDRDIWSSAHSALNLGAALSLWRHRRDLSEYSWGHGGYYSPRHYASLSVPLEWGGREGPLTWQVRGALSLSRSSSSGSDYYPGQPQLQASARALGLDPVYGESGSTGFGRSLRAAVEYQFSAAGAVGAMLSVERSAYYAPSQLMMYLRLLLEPVRAPHPDRPRPVQPYADF